MLYPWSHFISKFYIFRGLPLTALNWNFYFGLYTAHSENKFILNKLMTVCYWKLVQGTMKPSFSLLRAKSCGNCVFPPANVRVFVAVKVILTHLPTVRYRRILYSIYQEKNASCVRENAILYKFAVLLIHLWLSCVSKDFNVYVYCWNKSILEL